MGKNKQTIVSEAIVSPLLLLCKHLTLVIKKKKKEKEYIYIYIILFNIFDCIVKDLCI